MGPRKAFDRESIACMLDPADIYRKLLSMANEFAILGHMNTARDMVTLQLSQYSSPWQLRMVKRMALGFAEAGNWPDGVPPEWKTAGGLADLRESCMLTSPYSPHVSMYWNPVEDPAGTKDALLAAYENPSVEIRNKERALPMIFDLAVQQLNSTGASLIDIERDEEVQSHLSRIVASLDTMSMVTWLMKMPNIWPLLLSGALARKIPIDDNKIAALAEEALDTFSQRFREGRKPPPLENLPIPELV